MEAQVLARLMDAGDVMIVVADAEWRVLYVNANFSRVFGYSLDEAVGNVVGKQLAGPLTDTESLRGALLDMDGGGNMRHEGFLLYPRDGEPVWVSTHITRLRDADGNVTHTMLAMADITYPKMHEELQRLMLEAMASDLPLEDTMAALGRAIEKLVPEIVTSVVRVEDGHMYSVAAPSLPLEYRQAVDGLEIGPDMASCGAAAASGKPVLARDIASDACWDKLRAKVLPLGLRACWSTPILSQEDGRVLGSFAFYYREPRAPDAFHERLLQSCLPSCALAFEREENKRRIHTLAYTDALTGLNNRNRIQTRIESVLACAGANRRSCALLFIDLDRLKVVNDTRGHAIGDEVLCVVAQRLRENMRSVDSDLIGRLGGDEFVAVLTDHDAAQAAQAAQQLVEELGRTIALADGSTANSGASIGVAMYPHDGRDFDTLLRFADMAMYQAKNGGRGRHCFFEPEMHRRALARAEVESSLRESLENGEQLKLVYQPKLDADGHLLGVEALTRYIGAIPLQAFIDLVEECGLITRLTHWVVANACAQLAQWRAQGLCVPNLAINVSASDFNGTGLAEHIEACLREHGLGPADLTLEMTEGVMFESTPQLLETLQVLRALGVRLSIDDFGTGYSSLGSLHRFPIDEIKLDRSFVAALGDSAMARALTRSVQGIGDSLGIEVVAEGVETEAQHEFLRNCGYRAMQGFLFARPMPAEDFAHWLLRRKPAEAA